MTTKAPKHPIKARERKNYMDGIEKITQRILEDVRREAAQIADQAAQKAQEIRSRYDAQAQQETAAILSRGEKVAAERLERLESAAGLERRKMELAAKQQVLEEAFQKALDDLCQLPEPEYIALLAALAVKAARSGREQLIFSAKDRARVGKQVVMTANELLVKDAVSVLPDNLGDSKVGAFLSRVVQNAAAKVVGTGMLTLSEQTRDIRGGFVMSDDDVEVNCAFETLVRMQREKLEKEVADILFA